MIGEDGVEVGGGAPNLPDVAGRPAPPGPTSSTDVNRPIDGGVGVVPQPTALATCTHRCQFQPNG